MKLNNEQKRQYEKPSMEVLVMELDHRTMLLATSVEDGTMPEMEDPEDL